MILGKRLAILMAGLLLVPGALYAQQQATPAQTPAMTHLRVDIVLSEYSGEKKISSLPYTVYVGAKDKEHPGAAKESIRMGLRVPVASNSEGSQFYYQDIGTDIDCWASTEGDERYRIEGNIDRSSIYSADESNPGGEQTKTSAGHPVVRHFSSGFDLVLRDGETGEGVSATDPFNGHVLKISVTIHVAK